MEKAAIPKGPKYPLANIFIKIRKEMKIELNHNNLNRTQ
ncbi:MAG: hypothetical protein Ct9H90mP10_10570 [Actinomycetota bacterium]|nr:MAG: hypothetical protein Ct9H90mP10_10570 [Actinomycetota bacterium]